MKSLPTVPLFGMNIHRLTLNEAAGAVLDWAAAPRGATCRYVVTPNVDHAVMYQENDALRRAYREASLVLADGAPIVAASRALGRPLPERVAGSDLAPRLFDLAKQKDGPLSVYLLGAAPGVAERAAANIERRWPAVRVAGWYSPPLGFEKNQAENDRILGLIADAQPDVLLVGLGAPKQELWVQRFAPLIEAKTALCIGATIDFLAGHRRRSPRWLQQAGLEWLHRLASEPRRLAARYGRDAMIFPQLLWREIRGGFPAHSFAGYTRTDAAHAR
ncbi:Putative N-acetylmannosaminyltransferase [Pirellulimonas nuda]|uniref:N-acetylmannosaminyltransferase n=1 Tax=Pirellulimonas nuda TaxID=2528009 RepID=A0A518D7L6_9BACT|nr:WecB/TagA/CpsF family glycosyltransferase [Pirellulimonas nuda]QDU87446.1 Putative N-acetylmannosaminyltransferase [Pirellulimonas nuda]